jgi:hypothetical protein
MSLCVHLICFRLLCDCAKKAQSRGYKYIGLQYYAECWTSSEPEPQYDKDGPADAGKCVNAEFRACSQNDTACVGSTRANFVYKVIPGKVTSLTCSLIKCYCAGVNLSVRKSSFFSLYDVFLAVQSCSYSEMLF